MLRMKIIQRLFQAVDAEFENEAKALAEKDGWILKQNFIKYALGTDLCKDDPSQERVFGGKVTTNALNKHGLLNSNYHQSIYKYELSSLFLERTIRKTSYRGRW